MLRRHGDLVVALVLAAVLTTEVLLWETADLALAVPAALLATLPLALRRKTPLPAFLAVWAGTGLVFAFAPGIDDESAGFLLVFFLSLYSLGRHTVGHEVWLGGLCVLGYIVVFIAGDKASSPYDLGDVAFATGFVGGPWAAGLAIRLRREREQTLSARNAQLHAEQEEQARRAVAAERSRIARELHDVVSHAIAVTVLQARGARRMLGSDDEAVRRSLDAIELTNTQALGDMRRLLSLLRDAEDGPRDDPQPSLARLETLVGRLRESGLAVDLSVTGRPDGLPPGVDLSAYRIVQEALTNVLKHAPGAHARVSVGYGDSELEVTVSDDGSAVSTGDGRGHGLVGIRERVAVVGGRVEAGPADDGGFVVRARLPYAVEG